MSANVRVLEPVSQFLYEGQISCVGLADLESGEQLEFLHESRSPQRNWNQGVLTHELLLPVIPEVLKDLLVTQPDIEIVMVFIGVYHRIYQHDPAHLPIYLADLHTAAGDRQHHSEVRYGCMLLHAHHVGWIPLAVLNAEDPKILQIGLPAELFGCCFHTRRPPSAFAVEQKATDRQLHREAQGGLQERCVVNKHLPCVQNGVFACRIDHHVQGLVRASVINVSELDCCRIGALSCHCIQPPHLASVACTRHLV